MEYVLGIDVGTSACKASLIDHTGAAVSAGSDPYGFDAPRPEWAEQDAAIWWRGCRQGRRARAGGCLAQPRGRSPRSALSGSDALSGRYSETPTEVLRPPLLWCDQRPADEARRPNAMIPAIARSP